jgi:hypothetical protein
MRVLKAPRDCGWLKVLSDCELLTALFDCHRDGISGLVINVRQKAPNQNQQPRGRGSMLTTKHLLDGEFWVV